MTWTHEGRPIGQPQRPWRLTRAQRVEMEAALALLRARYDADALADGLYTFTIDGWAWLYQRDLDSASPACDHKRRILRARVAIALRAALRADEDARCDAALRRAGYGEGTGSTPGDAWDRGYDDGAVSVADELREWSPVRHDDLGLAPLALWEIDERRRRETVRAVVALLTWGLS